MTSTPTLSQLPPAAIVSRRHERLDLSYLQAGDAGPPIVMLHGWGAFKELWWSSLRDLGRDHRCFALDFPGHGESSFGGHSTIVRLAEMVADFCDDAGLREITLFGHSMGGSVAAELALLRPGLVRRLILVDAAVDAHLMPPFARTYLLPSVGWAALRVTQAIGRAFSPLGRRVPHEHGGGWLRPWLRRSAYLASFDAYGLHQLLRSLFATAAGERLTELSVPTLVISGQLDSLVPPANSRRLAAIIPGARYVQITAALHNPMDERPRAFVRAVRRFLAERNP
jgi:pimeloyl-ACP methyl ester carboxylesterase